MAERTDNTALCHEIIARIKARPEMWTGTDPRHRKRVTHKNFWRDLSTQMAIDENVLRKRWKHLKDQYRKELKRCIEKGLPEDEVGWKYFSALGFLRDLVVKDRDEEQPPSTPEAQSEESEGEGGLVARKVRIVEAKTDMIYNGLMEAKVAIEGRLNPSDDFTRHDPDYMYLMSLLPTLKQLNELQKLQLKGKINDWLLEAYLQQQCETKYIVSDVHHLSEHK